MGLAETITLPDGRTLGFDDVGEPAGVPVLYVHGYPIPAELGTRAMRSPRTWESGWLQ